MKVLLGVGGSPLSYEALESTIERAREAGDAVTVAVYANAALDVDRTTVERRVRETLDGAGIDAAIRHVEGEPGPALVSLADEEGFDRIVIASGTWSPLGKIQLGTIAEFVLVNARTPVTLVR